MAYIIREDERVYLTNSNGNYLFVYSNSYFSFLSESIPYLVNLLHEATNASDRRSNGLEARELCKGLSKLSVAENNKSKVRINKISQNQCLKIFF